MAEQVELVCKACRKTFKITASLYKLSIEKKYPRKFCSKSCAISAYQRKPMRDILTKNREFMKRLSEKILEKRPVTSFAQMTPEKQTEMKRLYENKTIQL